ncbi:MAG: hypothetical protein ACREN8_14065, partial [Candidatus Dormibacteraceae bacterium]
AVVGLLNRPGDGVAVLLWLVIVGTFAHSFTTTRAAPTNFSQRSAAGDQSRLTVIFDQFVRWQTVRVLLQITTLLLVVWVLVAQLQLMAASELSINFNV